MARFQVRLPWLWVGVALWAQGCTRGLSFIEYVPPNAGGDGGQALAAQAIPAVVSPNASAVINISGGSGNYLVSIPVANQHSGNPKVSIDPTNPHQANYRAGSQGNTTDVVEVADQSQPSQFVSVAIAVGAPLILNPTSITRAPQQTWSFSISGGEAPYMVSLTQPAGFPAPSSFLADGGCPTYGDGGIPSCFATSNGILSYQAGSYGTGGTDSLSVIDAAGTGQSATITITPALELEPAGAQTIPGGLVFFQATGGVPPYTYNFTTHGNHSDGTVHAGGTYQAGPDPNVLDVVYAQDAVGVVVSHQVVVGDEQLTLPTGRQYSLFTGDFNGDGFPDVVAVSMADSHPLVVTALGSSTGFIGTTTLSLATSAAEVVVGDFNHDGFDDLAVQPASNSFGTLTPLNQLLLLAGTGNGAFSVQPVINEPQSTEIESLIKVSTPLYQLDTFDLDPNGFPQLEYLGTGSDVLMVAADVEGYPDGGLFSTAFVPNSDGGFGPATFSDGGYVLPTTELQGWAAAGAGPLAPVMTETLPFSLFAQSNQMDPGGLTNDLGATLNQATFPDLADFPSATGYQFPGDFDYLSFVDGCDPASYYCQPALPCEIDSSSGTGTRWPLKVFEVLGFLPNGAAAFGFNLDVHTPGLFSAAIDLDGGWQCFPLPPQAAATTTMQGTFLSFDYQNPQPDLIITDPVSGVIQLDKSLQDGGFEVLPFGNSLQQATPIPLYWGTRPSHSLIELPGQFNPVNGVLESTSSFGTVLSELDAVGPAGITRVGYLNGQLSATPPLGVPNAVALVTADIDGDGLLDGVSIDSLSNLSFIRGSPTGEAYVGSARQLHRVTSGLDVGDFDADGLSDIVVPDLGVRVFYGDGDGQVGAGDIELGQSVALAVARGGTGVWVALLGASNKVMEVAHLDLSTAALAEDGGVEDGVGDGGAGDGGEIDQDPAQPVDLDPTQPVEMIGMTVGGDPRAAVIVGTPQRGGSGIKVATLAHGAFDPQIGDLDQDGLPLVAPLTSTTGTDLLVSVNSNCADVADVWAANDAGTAWTQPMGKATLVSCGLQNPESDGAIHVTGLFSVASQPNGPLDVLVAALSTYGAGGAVTALPDGGEGACSVVDGSGVLQGMVEILGASDIVQPDGGAGSASGAQPTLLSFPVEQACGAQTSWNVATADFDHDGNTDLLISDGQVIAIISDLQRYREWPAAIGPYPNVTYVLYAGFLDHVVVGDFNGDTWPDIAYTRSDIAELQVAIFHPDAGSYY